MGERRGDRLIAITRLERSVLSELWLSFGVAVAALTALMMVEMIYEAVLKGLPLGSLVKFAPLMLPYALPWTIPTAFVAACLMVYSRMAANNELMAVRASGIHVWRVLTPAAMTAAALCVICGVLNHQLVPQTRFFQYAVVKAASASEQAAAIQAADPVDPMMQIGEHWIYIGDLYEDGTFRDIVIVTKKVLDTADKNQAQDTYLRAPKGRYEYSDERSELVFYLEADPARNTPEDPQAGTASMHAVRHGPEAYDFDEALFGSCTLRIKLWSLTDLHFLPRRGKHMTTTQLLLKVNRRREDIKSRRRGQPEPGGMSPSELEFARKRWEKWRAEPRYWKTEIHKRSAMTLAPLLLAAIAVPIGVMIRRGHRMAAFGLSIAIVLFYYTALAGASRLGRWGMLPPAVALWGVTIVVAGFGGVLMWRMFKR